MTKIDLPPEILEVCCCVYTGTKLTPEQWQKLKGWLASLAAPKPKAERKRPAGADHDGWKAVLDEVHESGVTMRELWLKRWPELAGYIDEQAELSWTHKSRNKQGNARAWVRNWLEKAHADRVSMNSRLAKAGVHTTTTTAAPTHGHDPTRCEQCGTPMGVGAKACRDCGALSRAAHEATMTPEQHAENAAAAQAFFDAVKGVKKALPEPAKPVGRRHGPLEPEIVDENHETAEQKQARRNEAAAILAKARAEWKARAG